MSHDCDLIQICCYMFHHHYHQLFGCAHGRLDFYEIFTVFLAKLDIGMRDQIDDDFDNLESDTEGGVTSEKELFSNDSVGNLR